MAYNQKPETPLVNNGEFGDKIENRKWSEKKDKDAEVKQHGPNRIHNPDKLIEMGEGYKERHGLPLDKDHFISKEEYVRKGLRKKDNKLKGQEWAATLGTTVPLYLIGKHLNK